jgi:hypothetical protein
VGTNQQLYLAIGIPMLFNALLIGLVRANVNAQFEGLRREFETRFGALQANVDAHFRAIDQRFDDMRDLWRSELHRVEEILDARLKHLEGR